MHFKTVLKAVSGNKLLETHELNIFMFSILCCFIPEGRKKEELTVGESQDAHHSSFNYNFAFHMYFDLARRHSSLIASDLTVHITRIFDKVVK